MKNQSFLSGIQPKTVLPAQGHRPHAERMPPGYLQLDRSAYSCYELRRSAPSLDKLCQLARLYRVSTDFLLGVGGMGRRQTVCLSL